MSIMISAKRFGLGLGLIALLLMPVLVAAQDRPGFSIQPAPRPAGLVIATGPLTGVYYQVGNALCDALRMTIQGSACRSRDSAGSVANVDLLRGGDVGFAVIQADVQAAALAGDARFRDPRPYAELRAVMALHAEALTVAMRAADPWRSLDELKRRRLSLGLAGSGDRATTDQLLRLLGWSIADLGEARAIAPVLLSRALCNGEVDATFNVIGHPNNIVLDMATRCPLRFLSVPPDVITRYEAQAPYFVAVDIPADTYPTQGDRVATIGVRATLVASARQDEASVLAMTRAVAESLASFSARHPALRGLKREDLPRGGMTAPLHPGALRYYREAGITP
jgi:TRAP transporter TAXI family solute receptor